MSTPMSPAIAGSRRDRSLHRRRWARLATGLALAAAVSACAADPSPGSPTAPDDAAPDVVAALAFAPPPITPEPDPAEPGATTGASPTSTAPAPPPATTTPPPTREDDPDPGAAAPTDGLRRIAAAVETSMQGVELNVNLKAGIVTVPTEISVAWGLRRSTARYDGSAGVYIDGFFQPLNGAVRTEPVTITMTELDTAHRHMSIVKQVTVAPRFEVRTYPMIIEADLDGSCDLIGGADPTLVWLDPTGSQHSEDSEYGAVGGFDGRWSGVGQNTDHRMPTVSWFDRDPAEIGQDKLERRPEPMLPLPENITISEQVRVPVSYTRQFSELLRDSGGDGCSARLNYRIVYTLVY